MSETKLNRSMSPRWPALLDKQQAAEYLSISVRTLERLMADETLRPVAVRGSDLIRFRRIELDDYIQSLSHASNSKSIAARQIKTHSSECSSKRARKHRTEPAAASAVAGSGAG